MTNKRFFSIISTISTLAVMISTSLTVSANSSLRGDANSDNKINVRDAAFIAKCIVTGETPDPMADYNADGKIDIRDAAAISKDIINGNINEAEVQSVDTAEEITEEISEESFAEKQIEILNLVNQEREKVGAAPLTLNTELNAIADIRAIEASKSFSHTRPNGQTCFSIFEENNIDYSYCGENLAAGNATANETMQQWIDSVAHYENMIDPEFTELGVGFYYDENSTYKYYWVQIFECE